MKKLITSVLAVALFIASYSQGGDSTVTPVTGLHTLKGDHNRLTSVTTLQWSTFTETNNLGFVVYDGNDSIAFVKSRVLNGNSAVQTDYGLRISYPKRLTMEFGLPVIFGIMMVSLLLVRRNRKLVSGIAVIALFSFASCKKDQTPSADRTAHTYYLKQVDIDGHFAYSPTIKVQF